MAAKPADEAVATDGRARPPERAVSVILAQRRGPRYPGGQEPQMACRKTNAGWKRRIETMDEKAHEGSGWSWWYLLLIVQFVAVLWPPFYNAVEPAWAGIPFFYWYQMLWVIIAAVLTAIVYFATEK
jgi:hypothetical protein